MSITPADLAVGQVWVPIDATNYTRRITAISAGMVEYTFWADAFPDDQETPTRCLQSSFCEMLVDDECTLESPPVPHPAALADLYEACKALVDARLIADVDSAPRTSEPEPIRVSRMVRAALAKAGAK